MDEHLEKQLRDIFHRIDRAEVETKRKDLGDIIASAQTDSATPEWLTIILDVMERSLPFTEEIANSQEGQAEISAAFAFGIVLLMDGMVPGAFLSLALLAILDEEKMGYLAGLVGAMYRWGYTSRALEEKEE